MSDFLLESIRAIVVVVIFFYLWWVGRKENIDKQQGWLFIMSGFALILFGMLIDITDNFPNLDKYVVIGDTEIQAFLEKVVGYLVGFLLLSIGFWKWMPTVIALKKTKLELQESHDKLEERVKKRTHDLQRERDMFMQGPVMTFTWKNVENWPVEHVSANVAEILGYSDKEFLDGTILFASLIPPDELQRVADEVTTASQDKERSFTHKPYRLISRSGKTVWVLDQTTIIRNDDNEISHYQGYLVDITDTILISEQLRESQERLTVTLRSIGDGVITTDTQGRITFLNKMAEQLTGWGNEEANGKPSTEVFNIINEKTGQKCANPISRVLQIGRIVGLANHTALISKDESRRSIADSGAPIRNWESKIIGVVLVFRDITHEKKMEEELIKVKKLESVGILAGGIAHDFNNILSAIQGNIELAAYRVNKDAKALSLLSDAQKATKRATKLTQQLLTFSKGGDPVKETTSLTGLIRDSADFVLHGSHVSCDYTFPDDLWAVNVDSGQIGQVVQNIIINAKHAMPEGGRINIRCDNVEDVPSESFLSMHEGNFVRIVIQDTGIGIPQEIIDKIFDPYFTTKQDGSGLGLAICHSIINKHDGSITVQSSPGKGTTFTIYLPAVHSADITVVKQQKSGSAVKAARIMVMDDEEMIRNLAQAQLSTLGHKVVLVVDGEQAINRYQKLQDSGTPVDLVIMDLTVPGGMGGQEATRKLLQLDPEAKIIVASGYSNDPVMASYQEYGFCAAIAKPFDLTELRQVIESALS